MNLLDYTTTWAKGDIFQGRIMLTIGIVLLIAGITIFRSNHDLLKGMLIPLGLVVLILVCYGSVLAFTRSGHLENVKTVYAENQVQAIQKEYNKATTDNKNYTMLKPIWVVLIIISAILFYFLKTDYLKGLAIGLIGLFFTALLVDSMLHYRLKPYYEILIEFTSK